MSVAPAAVESVGIVELIHLTEAGHTASRPPEPSCARKNLKPARAERRDEREGDGRCAERDGLDRAIAPRDGGRSPRAAVCNDLIVGEGLYVFEIEVGCVEIRGQRADDARGSRGARRARGSRGALASGGSSGSDAGRACCSDAGRSGGARRALAPRGPGGSDAGCSRRPDPGRSRGAHTCGPGGSNARSPRSPHTRRSGCSGRARGPRRSNAGRSCGTNAGRSGGSDAGRSSRARGSRGARQSRCAGRSGAGRSRCTRGSDAGRPSCTWGSSAGCSRGARRPRSARSSRGARPTPRCAWLGDPAIERHRELHAAAVGGDLDAAAVAVEDRLSFAGEDRDRVRPGRASDVLDEDLVVVDGEGVERHRQRDGVDHVRVHGVRRREVGLDRLGLIRREPSVRLRPMSRLYHDQVEDCGPNSTGRQRCGLAGVLGAL